MEKLQPFISLPNVSPYGVLELEEMERKIREHPDLPEGFLDDIPYEEQGVSARKVIRKMIDAGMIGMNVLPPVLYETMIEVYSPSLGTINEMISLGSLRLLILNRIDNCRDWPEVLQYREVLSCLETYFTPVFEDLKYRAEDAGWYY